MGFHVRAEIKVMQQDTVIHCKSFDPDIFPITLGNYSILQDVRTMAKFHKEMRVRVNRLPIFHLFRAFVPFSRSCTDCQSLLCLNFFSALPAPAMTHTENSTVAHQMPT